MNQISPRVFEVVTQRTAMVLIRGRYSGLIEPEEHYIPLEPDYSDIDTVLDRVQDIASLQAMADRAYEHVIASGTNSYSTFIRRMDDVIEWAIRNKTVDGLWQEPSEYTGKDSNSQTVVL